MKTYIQQCKEKLIELNEESFDDFVDFWHTSDQTRNITLHDAIGITRQEYGQYILKSKELIEFLKSKVQNEN
jgi:hypothetical protein